jgi:hypothetical protein
MVVDSRTGQVMWRREKRSSEWTAIRYSAFVAGDLLYLLVSPKAGGFALQPVDLATGAPLPMRPIIENRRYGGNAIIPFAVRDGSLFAAYPVENGMLAYDLAAGRRRWDIVIPTLGGSDYILRIATDPTCVQPLVCVVWPNRYLLIRPDSGALLKDVKLPGYEGWSEFGAVLYSHPYLYAGARRRDGDGMAYDLVALNLVTDTIDWRHPIDRQSKPFGKARAEILNFVVDGRMVYVARADAKIMAFRSAPR